MHATRRAVVRPCLVVAACLLLAPEPSRAVDPVERADAVSPARRIRRGPVPPQGSPPRRFQLAVGRSIDGSGNHADDPGMGAAGTPMRRLFPADYADGVSAMAGLERPGARMLSNRVHDQPDVQQGNPLSSTDFLWQWGQFLDHDIALSDGMDPPEPAPIAVPAGDPFFDPLSTGSRTIAFNRSLYDPSSQPRQQLNEVTAWIDASNVYGSDEARAAALRTRDGTGRLRTGPADLLPFNDAGLPNAGGEDPGLFLAGDVRANEQVGLIALHTLFVREHNRLAAEYAARFPRWSGDRIYQRSRRVVGALMQVITYREFLPALLGPGAMGPYRGYEPEVDARISNEFAAAAYRFGHSAVGPQLLRLDASGQEIPEGHLLLRDAFFAPGRVRDEGGIEPLLRGLASHPCQPIDPYLVDDLRNFLFGPPGAGGFDLAAMNVQRGRDHGLPSYNDVREALGFGRAESFSDVSPDPEIQSRLASAYDGVDDVDLWVGVLAEPPMPRAHVGRVAFAIVAEQFEALRSGDRHWYARELPRGELEAVEATRLSDVIRRNTQIGDEIPDDVFHARP